MSRFLIPLSIVLFLIGIALNFSPGFSLSRILIDLPEGEESNQQPPKFSEPYKYLSHGRQTFVFESADGKSVLKLFNQNYLRTHWYHSLPAPRKWKERQKRNIPLRQRFYEESYPLAFQEIPEETGILYLHLKKTDRLLPSIKILDPSGRESLIDLNRTAFVLQRKAEAYLEYMEKVSKKEGFNGLKREIDAFLDFTAKRIDQKIADHDHDIWENMGILEGKLLLIDPGKLYKKETLSESGPLQREWWKATHRLHKWLLECDPEAAAYLNSYIIQLLKQIVEDCYTSKNYDSKVAPLPRPGSLEFSIEQENGL